MTKPTSPVTAVTSQPAQTPQLDARTRQQLAALSYGARDLIVCDVDEVVLHFVRPLEAHFQRQGYGFKEKIFKLTGNVRHLESDDDAPDHVVRSMIHSYFEADAHQQAVVPGVVEAINRLADHADILFLTNMPHAYRPQRVACLAQHGLNFPVITNTGPKGPALSAIAEQQEGAVWFIDDSPMNLMSVAAFEPAVELVHFVADAEFLALADHVPEARLRTNCWAETHAHIHAGLVQAAA